MESELTPLKTFILPGGTLQNLRVIGTNDFHGALECGDDLGAFGFRNDGTGRSLGRPDGLIRVHSHDQPVPFRLGRLEIPDVSDVEQVEQARRGRKGQAIGIKKKTAKK